MQVTQEPLFPDVDVKTKGYAQPDTDEAETVSNDDVQAEAA